MLTRLRCPGVRLGMTAIAALALAGCGGAEGDDRPREPVSGTVNFGGQPLKGGTIQFQPASQSEGVASGGLITDGRFDVPRVEGPVPGQYNVAIYAEGNSEPTHSDQGPMGAQPRYPRGAGKKAVLGRIPPRYNIQTELTAEVKPGGPNTYTFDLKP